MNPIRIVLASMPFPLLGDIVREVAGKQPDLDVLEVDVAGSSLQEAVQRHKADAVVVGVDEADLPVVFRDLLEQCPATLAVGITAVGRKTMFQSVCKYDIGINELFDMIRASKGSGRNGGDDCRARGGDGGTSRRSS